MGSDGRILDVACWAHARRKFFEARSSSPAEASLGMEMIRRIYEVEDLARPLDDAACRARRAAEALPILERRRAELDRLRCYPRSSRGAKRHRLEPWAYLHDVILKLSVDASPELLIGLLPDRRALAHPKHVLTHRLEESRQKAARPDERRRLRRLKSIKSGQPRSP